MTLLTQSYEPSPEDWQEAERLSPSSRRRLADILREAVDAVAWRDIARPDQLPPLGWRRTWYVRGGRFGGKTWTGSHTLAELIRTHPVDKDEQPTEWAVIAPTFADARDTCIEGRSGLLRAFGLPLTFAGWNRSMGALRLPGGQIVYAGGADDGALRAQGKNLSGAWCDEVGLWKRWQVAWDESIAYAVRIEPALIVATGTPKRNMPARALIRRLLDDPKVVNSRLRSEDNRAHIAASAWDALSAQAGTTLGRQELEGDLLDEVEGALWTPGLIKHWPAGMPLPALRRTVVAVDPSGSEKGDATGVVAVSQGEDGDLYVRDDKTLNSTPQGRYEAACLLAHRLHAGEILVEQNYGGDMAAAGIASAWQTLARAGTVVGSCPLLTPVSAKGSKTDRALTAVQVYEQGRVWHAPLTPDALGPLEDEQTTWTPTDSWSPNRLDSLVHAVRHLNPGVPTEATIHVPVGAVPIGAGASASARYR